MKYHLLIGCVAAVVCFADAAVAKSRAEIRQIAQAITVKIEFRKNPGSGVIIHRAGEVYTVVTNNHVVCGEQKRCAELSPDNVYTIGTVDGQQYRVTGRGVKLLGNDLDLAIVQFRSSKNYPVAQIADTGSLKVNDKVYSAGFPAGQNGFTFDEGEAVAVVNKRLTEDKGGYTVIYDALTLPGMSGSGIYNDAGQLAAIHGSGDRYRLGTEIDDESMVGSKIGYNRGIPVRWLVQGLGTLGINLLKNRPLSAIQASTGTIPATADEHFIAGFNKSVEPGENVQVGKKQAIQKFSSAININSKYARAYFMRAYVYDQLNETNQAFADYNKAIGLNPKYAGAYNNRGILKANKLNNTMGALADYNKAIELSPQYTEAYNNRGVLKAEKLNDTPGALDDYNKAIELNPQYSKTYNNRAILRKDKLNDTLGSLADYNKAIELNSKFTVAYYNRGNLKKDNLKDTLGALADYNKAIELNSKFTEAYINRGLLKTDNLKDTSGALADYNQAIELNPRYSQAYNNRAILRTDKLNDTQGALVDYNQAIILNPQYANAYYNRGNLKKNKLNDTQGALADYNQAIILNPQYANAYYNRGNLKQGKLNDRQGAIADFRQAAKLYRQQSKIQELKDALDRLKDLGATEL